MSPKPQQIYIQNQNPLKQTHPKIISTLFHSLIFSNLDNFSSSDHLPSMSTPPPVNFDLWKILSETKLIIRSHGRQYFILSLLFLLPTSFLITIYPFIFQKLFLNSDHPPPAPFPHFPTIANLLYIFTLTLFSISGIAPITYTTIHSLCQNTKPEINLRNSVKSIIPSFLPLASSLIIQELIFGSFSAPFVGEFIQLYIKNESFSNYYNTPFMILPRIVLILCLIYFQANWTLSSAIAVCESSTNGGSKWGLKPLKKSSQLVTKSGKTGTALAMVLLFDLMWATFFCGFYNIVFEGGSYWDWGIRVYVIMSLIFMILTLLLNMVANVVLYFHCLEIHGEVPFPYTPLEEEGSLPH